MAFGDVFQVTPASVAVFKYLKMSLPGKQSVMKPSTALSRSVTPTIGLARRRESSLGCSISTQTQAVGRLEGEAQPREERLEPGSGYACACGVLAPMHAMLIIRIIIMSSIMFLLLIPIPILIRILVLFIIVLLILTNIINNATPTTTIYLCIYLFTDVFIHLFV